MNILAIEGWVIIVRGLHEETDEDSLVDKFREYGDVKTVHLNLDRRTGYVKVIEKCAERVYMHKHVLKTHNLLGIRVY